MIIPVNVIADCETLGTSERAVITQVAIAVIPQGMKVGLVLRDHMRTWKLDQEEQMVAGRVKEKDTLAFWDKQPDEVRNAIIVPKDDDVPVKQFAKEMIEFLQAEGCDSTSYFWQRGSKDYDWINSLCFDAGVVLKQAGMPIDWWCARDIRTAIDVLGYSSKCNGYMDQDKVPDAAHAVLDNIRSHAHDASADIARDLVYLRIMGLV